jgi:hypothetical protein
MLALLPIYLHEILLWAFLGLSCTALVLLVVYLWPRMFPKLIRWIWPKT